MYNLQQFFSQVQGYTFWADTSYQLYDSRQSVIMQNRASKFAVALLLVSIAWIIVCQAGITPLDGLPFPVTCESPSGVQGAAMPCQVLFVPSPADYGSYPCISTPIAFVAPDDPPTGHPLPHYRPPRVTT